MDNGESGEGMGAPAGCEIDITEFQTLNDDYQTQRGTVECKPCDKLAADAIHCYIGKS